MNLNIVVFFHSKILQLLYLFTLYLTYRSQVLNINSSYSIDPITKHKIPRDTVIEQILLIINIYTQ